MKQKYRRIQKNKMAGWKRNIRKTKKKRNTVTEIKNTLEEIGNRLIITKEWVSDLEDRIVEITQLEQQNEKNNKEIRIV